ncbi:leucine-rich repeat domain-containing protein, partial [Listeria monocytogenes]|uniref:leucine-rich repeat domain-containing protein n=1 Tax=Listeria monocytogenes TaxID=1639 RepID=UPI00125C3B92
MRFSRKEREQTQKNWRMWKKGKQWLCGAALFFTVISSPGMIVLADEVNSGNSTTAATAGEVEMPIPEESTENEVEEITEEDETSSTEAVAPSQQEENTPSTAENNGTKTVEGKKERPKQGRLITTPTAISDIFPDANLANNVASYLSKSPSDIVTQSDLDGITNLRINSTVMDISGMEHLVNLTSFVLAYGTISDLSPISGLTNLTNLSVPYSDISDLSPISGLANLDTLNLYGNQVSDLSPISGLTNLTNLDVGNTLVSDLSPISGLTNLTYLSSNNTPVSDLSPISGLTNLTNLSFSDNSVSDLSPISGLTNLTNLNFDDNSVSDLSPISGLTNLTNLNFDDNSVSDLSPISGLTNLVQVYFNGNKIHDISIFSGMPNVYFSGWNQEFTLPEVKWSSSLEIEMPFTVISTNGVIDPYYVTNDGLYEDGVAIFDNLPNSSQDIMIMWNEYSAGVNFSVRVTVRVIPVEVKILVDSDGDSQTTGDQTLLAEESD